MKKCVFLYEADHVNKIINVDEESMKRAGQITNPEFKKLTEVMNALPGYTLDTKKFPKKDKRTYCGLTIKVMQAFIIQYEDAPEKAAKRLEELKVKKAEGLLKGATYAVVKSWFLDHYGKVFNGSALSKEDSKREALINELLASVDSSLIEPIADMEEKGVA